MINSSSLSPVRTIPYPAKPLVDPTLEEMGAFKDETRVRREAMEVVAGVDDTLKMLKSRDQKHVDRCDQVGTVVVENARASGRVSELKYDPASGTALSAEGVLLRGFPESNSMRFQRDGDLLQYQTTYHSSSTSWADSTPCEHIRNVTLDLKNGTLTYSTAFFKAGAPDFGQTHAFAAPGPLPVSPPSATSQEPVTKWSQPFPVKQGNVGSARDLEEHRSQQHRQRQAQESQERVNSTVGRMQKLEKSDENMSAGHVGRVTVMNTTGGAGLLGWLLGETSPLNGELTYDPANQRVLDFRGQLSDPNVTNGTPRTVEYHRVASPQGELECYREGSQEYRINRSQGTLSLVEYGR